MSSIQVLVPDASVLLKWVIESEDEEDRDRALEIRQIWLAGKCDIVLPALWFFEVGNILGMKQPNIPPFLGRYFAEADDASGAPNTVVLSYGFWQRHFG